MTQDDVIIGQRVLIREKDEHLRSESGRITKKAQTLAQVMLDVPIAGMIDVLWVPYSELSAYPDDRPPVQGGELVIVPKK